MSETEGLTKKTEKSYFRLILWCVVAAVLIYLIARNFSAFSNILLVALGFGAVVLVHEFGHFIVAKLSGVKVEAFSIGFPPTFAGIRRAEDGYHIRILPKFFPKEDDPDGGNVSFKLGKKGKASETEYRIGVVPIGGFVKMLGQDDIGPVKTSDDPRSYANKPATTRMAILAAGVICNVISAMLIFMIVFMIGINLPPAVVGGVVANSPAEHAGLKAGDEIIEIDGESENLDFSNIQIAAALSDVNEPVKMTVRREDGSEEELTIVARLLEGNPMRLFGVEPAQSLTIAKVADANSLRERLGLIPGDRITSINGIDVQTHWQMMEIVRNCYTPTVVISGLREGDAEGSGLVKSEVRIGLETVQKRIESESDLGHIYSMVPRLMIEAANEKTGLKQGDIILSVGEVENPTFKELRDVADEYEKQELDIKVLRRDADGNEETVVVTVEPRRPRGGNRAVIGIYPILDAEHAVVSKTIAAESGPAKLDIPRGAVITAVDGIAVSSFYDVIREIRRYPGQRVTVDWRLNDETAGSAALDVDDNGDSITVKSAFAEYIPFDDFKRLYRAGNPVEAIGMGYKKTIMFITQTYLTLRRLVSRDVSPKSLMGPVGILAASYTIVSERPFVYYAYFLGLISACIAVVNFLPLPPLDGGLVVLLVVEKIKGSALSEKTQGVIAYAGWVLIGAFFLYITFNDVVRTFFG